MPSLGGGSKKIKVENPEPAPPTAAETALATKAAQDFNYYVQNFVPIKDRVVDLISSGDAVRFSRRQAQGSVEAQTASQTSVGRGESIFARRAEGVGRGGQVGDILDRSSAYRRSLASGIGAAEPAIRDRIIRGRLAIGSVGRGLQDAARLGERETIRRTTEHSINRAQDKHNTRMGITDAIGSGVGAFMAFRGGS